MQNILIPISLTFGLLIGLALGWVRGQIIRRGPRDRVERFLTTLWPDVLLIGMIVFYVILELLTNHR